MNKMSVLALALAAASQANAVEVFNNETAAVDLYGRVYAGHFVGEKKDGTQDYSEKNGANHFIRFGAKANTQVQAGLSAIAQYEVQLYINDNEKTLAGDDDGDDKKDENLRTRLAFAGLKGAFGTVTFGRQKGALGTLADWTDVALSDGYGAKALGTDTDTFATNRAGSVIKYSHALNNFTVDASYKLDGNQEENLSDNASDAAYGAAITYRLPFNVTLGGGYNLGQRNADNEEDAKLWLASAKFDNKTIYAAFSYASGSDFIATGTDHRGYEAALGYNVSNGIGLMALWNKQEREDTTTGKKTDKVDYYTLGAHYKLNKNLRLIAEYRLNNLDALDAGKAEKTKDDFQLAARYDF
ncbi:MAG: porin [Aeromonas sp.]